MMNAKHGLFRRIAGLALVGLLALVLGRSLSQSPLPPRPFAGLILAENAHPFKGLSLRIDNPFGLFGLTGSSLGG